MNRLRTGDIVCIIVVYELFILGLTTTNLVPRLISRTSVCATNPHSCNKDDEHQSVFLKCATLQFQDQLASRVQGWRSTISPQFGESISLTQRTELA